LILAGNFIIDKFKEYGLQPFPGSLNFYQAFNAGDNVKGINRDDMLWNGRSLPQSQFYYLTSEMLPEAKTLNDFNIVEYDGVINDSIYVSHWLDTTNTLIWMKHPQPGKWENSLENFHDPGFPPSKKILFVVATDSPSSLLLSTNAGYKKNALFNIIGVLPGKT